MQQQVAWAMAGKEERFSLNATTTTTWTTPLIAHQSKIPIPIPPPLPTRLDGHPDSRIRYTTLTANRSALELLNDVMLGHNLPTSLSQGCCWSNNTTKAVLNLITAASATAASTSSTAAASAAAAPPEPVEVAKPTPRTLKLERDAMLQDFAQRMALLSASLQETRRATEGMVEEDGSGGSASRDMNLWTLPGSAEEEEVEQVEEEEEEQEGSEEQQEGDGDEFEHLKKRMELLEADLEQTRQALKLRLRDVEAAQRPCFLCNQAKHLAKFCPLWTGQESWRANPEYQDFTEGLGDLSMEGFGLFEFEDSSL